MTDADVAWLREVLPTLRQAAVARIMSGLPAAARRALTEDVLMAAWDNGEDFNDVLLAQRFVDTD